MGYGLKCCLLLLCGAALNVAAQSSNPPETLVRKACANAEEIAHCSRLVEQAWLPQFKGVAERSADGKTLRIFPSEKSEKVYAFKDVIPSADDTKTMPKQYSFWTYWPGVNYVVISESSEENEGFLLLSRAGGQFASLSAEPVLSPDRKRVAVADFCGEDCGNKLEIWRLDTAQPVLEKTWQPKDLWLDGEVVWDSTTNSLQLNYQSKTEAIASKKLSLTDSAWKLK